MTIVVDTPDFLIERDDARRLIRLRRTESKFSLDKVDAIFAPVVAALAEFDGWSLLLDMRRAPPRTDDAFEAAINVHLNPILVRFRRRAVLVRSAVGVLQVNRVSKKMGATDDDTAVFRDDEAAAEAFLAAG